MFTLAVHSNIALPKVKSMFYCVYKVLLLEQGREKHDLGNINPKLLRLIDIHVAMSHYFR